MAILQVRDLDDRLYLSLKDRAKKENRSLSQEVVSILETFLSNPHVFRSNPTRDFLSLSSAWEDDRSAEEIMASIRGGRRNSPRFGADDALFD